MFSETCVAPVNIAVIKYWGKRDEDLILPVNDSLSMTLSTDQMSAKTTVAASAAFREHKMWLNGEEVPFEENPRIARCLEELKRVAGKKSPKFPLDWKLHVCSQNNFPTAAGLASSAAGYACLVYALACLFGIEDEDLTHIARMGSGSACRSMHGGFVQWKKGELKNGSDSVAVQVQPSAHWPDMRVLILVVSDSRKKTGSTKGMRGAVETSNLLKYRAETCVPQSIAAIKKAINARDFSTFAEITIRDSNQFHAICLDTFPPCVYMNDVSHAICDFVHKYNEAAGENKIAYTFDAGPNACFYLLAADVPNVLNALHKVFPNDNASSVEYIKGIPIDNKITALENEQGDTFKPTGRNLLKYIIYTKIGEGPQKLSPEQSLLNENGLPKWLS